MRRLVAVVVLGAATMFTAGVVRAVGEPPAWAYAIPPAPPAAPALAHRSPSRRAWPSPSSLRRCASSERSAYFHRSREVS